MYRENTVTPWTGRVILATAFMIIFGSWAILPMELFREEALYAVEALEFSWRNFMVTAQETPIRNGYPLYPALVSLLYNFIPMETALRCTTIFFIAAGAVLIYFSAATGNGRRAGFAAAAMYISTLFILDKGVNGSPESMSSFFLLAAQMCFFYFGMRRGKWHIAWAGSSLLLIAGYFTGGFIVPVLFIAPMIFFRRLIAGKAKYRNWGFIAGLLLLLISCSGKLAVQWSLERTAGGTMFFRGFAEPDYLQEFLTYWLTLPVWLLPWSFIAWIPFCAALQHIDDKPLFSKYLRINVMVTAALLWLIPGDNNRELFYLTGNLSILCGVYYELGMRRFGERLRKLAPVAEYVAPVVIMMFAAGIFAEKRLLEKCFSLSNTLNFRNAPETLIHGASAVICILLIWALLRLMRRTMPVWIVLLSVSVMAGTFSGVILLRYRAQDSEKSKIGYYIRKTLQDAEKSPKPPILYKRCSDDLYGELFYSGARVVRIHSVDDLPDSGSRVIYLLSNSFPQNPKWSWRNLLPEGYLCNGKVVMLWRGTRNFRENFNER